MATVVLALMIFTSAWCQVGGGDAPAGQLSVEDLIQRKDPANDDWATEKIHDHAKHQLQALGNVLADAKRLTAADLSRFFTDDCQISNLRPLQAATRQHFGKLEIWTTQLGEAGTADRRNLQQAFADLMSPYGSIGGQRFAFKALRVSAGEDGRRFDTVMFYQCFGPAAEGLVEQHALWDIRWRVGDDPEHPLIERLMVGQYSEARAPSEYFSDRSAAVLSAVPAWREQLQYGADFWHQRVDTLGGVTFLGHQGIAIGDVTGDGLDDLYVAQSTGMPNLLLLHHADGTVVNVAAQAGVDFLDDTKGVLLVDIDNDGDQDLCCALGPTILILANDGGARFSPLAALHAPDESDFYSLSAADYDADGDLDLYATRYVAGRYGVSVPIPWHDANNGPTNHLFRNDGRGVFTDVTREVGLDANNRRFSLAASWVDYDNDGDLDLYVANDFGRNNLYRNDQGRFSDVAATSGTEDQAAGMGVSWADYDLDGLVDLHVGNMFSSAGNRIAYQRRFQAGQPEKLLKEFQRHAGGNSLYRNTGDGTFVDVSGLAGIRMGRWSWGARFVDINLDGYPDIVSPNGFITNAREDDL